MVFLRKICYNFRMDVAILKFFQQMRAPFWDGFFSCFSFLGEATTVTVAVILAYWLLGRAGEQLAVSTLTTLPLNVFLKVTVARPRPYVAGVVSRVEIDNFLVSTVDLLPNASFPSGHAQISSTILTGVAYRAKRAWTAILCLIAILLVATCRLYFGVHYPSDVLTGLALGIALAIFWEIIYAKVPNARFYILAGFAVLALLPLFFFVQKEYQQAAGLTAGVAIFLPFASRIAREPKGWKRLLRIPLGLIPVAVCAGIGLLLPEGEAFSLLTYALIAGGGTLGAQALFRLCRV